MKETLRHLRANQTLTEKIVWAELKNRKFMNLKFRRQYPIGGFILDFYCAELKLEIEIDGKIHERQKEYDKFRQELIEQKDLRFIRVTNEEVVRDVEILLGRVKAALLET